MDVWDAAGATIEAAFGATVKYSGAGLDNADVFAIRSDVGAPGFQGFDGTPAKVNFEIKYALLPEEPRKGNLIVEANGNRWSVIDRDERDDVVSWVLWVEKAPAP